MRSTKGWKAHLWLFPCLLLFSASGQQLPYVQPSLNLGNLPETSFSCDGKVVGGYYTDFDTDCRMFHVCTLGSKGETQDIKFLCIDGTAFDQKTSVCERAEEVQCFDSSAVYDVNKQFYHNSNKVQIDFDGNVTDNAVSASVSHSVPPAQQPAHAQFPPADYADDFVQPTRTGTRSEVPLFRRPNRQQRHQQVASVPPRQQAFRRFLGAPVSRSTPPALSTTPVPLEVVTVPIIPRMTDPDRPRVVVTNGKPFVPKLNGLDPAPALTAEESFPSLALPETNFSCEGKVSGGHYADPETNCKMFHICVIVPDDTITDYKFLCGEDTVFDQKSRTCQETDKVDCASSVLNYYVNNHLIIPQWLESLARQQALQGVTITQSQISQTRAIAKRNGLAHSPPPPPPPAPAGRS